MDLSYQIEEVMQELYDIVSHKDIERLSKKLAGDVILHNTDGSIIEGKTAYLKWVAEIWPTYPDFTTSGTESKIIISKSNDLAVVVGEHSSVYNESGENVGRWLHTFVWEIIDDMWKMKVFSMIQSST